MASYYVHRDASGVITAIYGEPQTDETGAPYTDADPIQEDHPDIVAFFNPPTTVEDYRTAIRVHVDAIAQSRNYDSGLTCATYVNSTNERWSAEAYAFVAWRDTVWDYAFGELERVENGQRQQPSIQEFIAELPPIGWPTP